MYILKENIINVKENLNIEIKSKISSYKNTYGRNSKFGEVKLIRDLKTDTFDLEISRPPEYDIRNKKLEFYPYVNFNNNFQFSESGFKDKFKQRENTNELYYRIPSGLIENKKFSNIKELYVGLVHKDEISKDPYMHMMKFNFKNNFKRIHLEENQSSRLKIVKEILINFDYKNEPLIKFNLFEFYYVPIEKNRKNTIEDIANIYVYSKYYKKEDDTLLDEGKIKTSSIKTGLKTRFIKENSKEILEIIGENMARWPIKIGRNTIIDHTYYDYKKKKTFPGFESKSIPGEIIPYNFQGSYTWLDTMDIFYVFKNFTFVTTKMFDEPYLDLLNGSIQLEIQNIDQKKFFSDFYLDYSLDKKSLEIIRNNKSISLKSLERISIET